MKNTFALPAHFIKKAVLLFVSISGLLFVQYSFAQFTSTWALTSDQSFATTGAAAADVTGANQAMSGTLFIPAANSYAGVSSSPPEGQRCSPKQNDGNDGGWLIDGSAVEGRYMEFVVNPNTGFDMNVTTIAFSIGNRSTSNLRGSAYYYVGATNAAFTMATGTALGTALRAGTSTNQYNSYSYTTSINVTSGNKIFVRIYPYNTASLNTGKYFCTKAVSISGTTTSPNVTDITFTTPGTCINNQITVSWTGPSGFNAATTTLLAFLKPTSAVTIGTPSSTLATYTASTVFGTGTNYQNDAAAKCIYKATGTDAFGNHSGLTITGLTANTTYHMLIFIVANVANTYSAGAVGNGTTLAAAVAEPTNHPTVFAKGTVTASSIAPTWTAAVAGAQAPLGYLLQASNSATPADPGSVSPLDGTDMVDQTNISGGTANAKVTPNTATTYAGITGFSSGTMYYYRINSYTNTGSCINYKPTGLTMNAATLPNAVTSPLMIISGTTGTISWTTAAGYNNSNHTTLVFVKAASAVNAGTPTSNPSTYTASTNFASPLSTYQLDASATCVYKGDGTTVNVTGLTAGASYFILILTVVDASNSDATNSYSAYATATSGLTYTWIGGNSSWITAANWSPARTTPATTDVLIFNTPGAVTITSNTIP
ncbi:MAG: hypothetical protein IPP72_15400 [Chitinophagaceae bacterium]|nr:hypothetical protein [Chitinophagaceae bacterium]